MSLEVETHNYLYNCKIQLYETMYHDWNPKFRGILRWIINQPLQNV